MKEINQGQQRKRGVLARVFLAMLAMSAVTNDNGKTVNVDRGGGFYGGSSDYMPRKHKSYIKQRKDAEKRRIKNRTNH